MRVNRCRTNGPKQRRQLASILINGNTALYGIIGNPLGHSFSPEMHTLAFQHLGLNAVYVPFPALEKDLSSLLNALSIIGVKGFNVTIPYKEKIVPLLDAISPTAQKLGSVNTVIRKGNLWKGFSTDGSGLIRFSKEAGINFKNKKVILLGGGGSAKSVALAVSMEEASDIVLINRTKSKAQKIADMVLKSAPEVNTTFGGNRPIEGDVLINCTSVGMKIGECPVSDDQIQACQCVIDIIYNPIETTLIRKAKGFGLPTYNGLGMLLYQGIEAFEIWTGQPAPKEIMTQSLRRSMDKTL